MKNHLMLLLLLLLSGCGEDQIVYDFEFDGSAKNFLGYGGGYDEHDFDGWPFSYRINIPEGYVVFYSHNHVDLVLIFDSLEKMEYNSHDGGFEAWLVREPLPQSSTGVALDYINNFIQSRKMDKMGFVDAFSMQGTVSVLFDGGTIERIKVNLKSEEKMPFFSKLIEIRKLNIKSGNILNESGLEYAWIIGEFIGRYGAKYYLPSG